MEFRPGEPVLVTAPGDFPVSLAEVKAQAKVTHDREDADILRRMKASVKWAEGYLRRKLITQTWEVTYPTFPSSRKPLLVPFPPLAWDTAVVELAPVNFVKYIDGEGELQTLATTEYSVRENRTPGEIVLAYGKSWPSVRSVEDAITVRFTCGYGTKAADVPDAAREAICILAATRQAFREDSITGTIVTAAPFGVKAMLASVPRVMRF